MEKRMEWFRIITPASVTIILFLTLQLLGKIDKLDDKVFKHLTNDELHSTRSQTISKAEFITHCELNERDRKDTMDLLKEIRTAVKK